MKYIDFSCISSMDISAKDCNEWVRDAFLSKYESVLPNKLSIKMENDIFVNTMPCYLPNINRLGVKVVSRYPQRIPSLQSDLLLYDSLTGELLALMDGLWITTMRTGAVAAIAIQTLKKKNAKKYSFIGLGNTARSTLLCLLESINNEDVEIGLLAYNEQEYSFIERFAGCKNVKFNIYSSKEELILTSDVVVSCVTVANELFAEDHFYLPGVLVVPVHTRGFQNCDLFFDKIYVDDTDHVRTFKYFDKFKNTDEISNILLGRNKGRESDEERILSYNIGLALHDVYFASMIYDKLANTLEEKDISYFSYSNLTKFWI